jgi:site-specific recombinase XerD
MTPPGAIPIHTTFHDLEKPYLAWLSEGETLRPYSKNSIRAYHRVFREFLAFSEQNGLERPDEVNGAWVRAFVRQMTARGLSLASIRMSITGMQTFFAFCQYEGLVEQNPVEAYLSDGKATRRGGREAKRLPPVLYHHEREALIDTIFSRQHVNRDRDLAMIGLFLDSGLRTEELCSLTIGQGKELLQTGSLRVIGKGNKERIVRPLLIYRSFLQSYMEARRTAGENEPLFITRRGTALRQANVHKMVSYYLKRADIQKPQMGAHLLRHTAASLILASGENIRRVQENLGHASIVTTERYTHLLDAPPAALGQVCL